MHGASAPGWAMVSCARIAAQGGWSINRFSAILLLTLGFDWLTNVIFGEPTVGMRERVIRAAIAKRREAFGAG